MDPLFLNLQQVQLIHARQIARFGGSTGVRDLGLLQSAIAQAPSQFSGQFLHADLHEMAAAYLFHLVKNHPFLDGNKRVALESALVFLWINGLRVRATSNELVDLVLGTISGAFDKPAIANFFRSRAVNFG